MNPISGPELLEAVVRGVLDRMRSALPYVFPIMVSESQIEKLCKAARIETGQSRADILHVGQSEAVMRG